MSILIKGMEMPKSCSVCRLFGEYGCPFIGAVGHALTRGERNEDCPLVSVPPHGRLIDADALKAHNPMLGTLARWMIDAAPTIDAVHVVRCKDCAYFSSSWGETYCRISHTNTDEDWYCADGEREDDERP